MILSCLIKSSDTAKINIIKLNLTKINIAKKIIAKISIILAYEIKLY